MSWFVVVERWDMKDEEIAPYVVGPYPNEDIAKQEANHECNIIYSLLTIDSKSENYQAVECYWTNDPPKNGELIDPEWTEELQDA